MKAQKKIGAVIKRLQQKAHPVRIILFGSRAKNKGGKNSDFDLLVIEKKVPDRRRESVRLMDALRPLGINADLVVVSEKFFKEWAETPGNLIYEAAKQGKVLYEMEGARG